MYDLKATDEQLASIEKALRANELQRKAMLDAEKPAPKKKPARPRTRKPAGSADGSAG